MAVVLLYCHSELCWLWAVGESWVVLTVTFGGGLTRRKSRATRQDADSYMPRTPFVLLRDGRVASKAYICRRSQLSQVHFPSSILCPVPRQPCSQCS